MALVLCYTRAGVAPQHVRHVRRVAGLAVVLQLGHFIEEYMSEFYVHFPALLGLAPWPEPFFVVFNLFWVTVWGLSIAGIARFPQMAALPLWFLAIASFANGIVHPLLALVVGGYFPGLWSSPLVGILGTVLFAALVSATSSNSRNTKGTSP